MIEIDFAEYRLKAYVLFRCFYASIQQANGHKYSVFLIAKKVRPLPTEAYQFMLYYEARGTGRRIRR